MTLCSLCDLPIPDDVPSTSTIGRTRDHVVPMSRGGSRYRPGNQLPAHRICNGMKSDAVAVSDELRERMRAIVTRRLQTYQRSHPAERR